MGNLEDELAGAWEEGDEDELLEEDEESARVDVEARHADFISDQPSDFAGPPSGRNQAQDPATSPMLTLPNGKSSSPKKQRKRNNTRTSESMYDGSDYGEPDSPPGSVDLPPELRILIRDVEELARQGSSMFLPHPHVASQAATDGSSTFFTKPRNPPLTPPPTRTSTLPSISDPGFATLHQRLRDLGGQTTLEALTTRLITAHTSLTTHLAHQTRTLQAAAFPLLSPLSVQAGIGPSLEDAEALLPLLSEALESIPQPSFTSLNSLSHLTTTGKEAVSSLASLSDSLHMSRQVEVTAARRLKSARECAMEIRREYEFEEVGRKFVIDGGWDRRIKEREAKRICGEVTGGFEEVCEGWRRRLVDAAAAQGVTEVSV